MSTCSSFSSMMDDFWDITPGDHKILRDPADLPTEVFLMVASYLPPIDIIRAQRVARAWRSVLNDPRALVTDLPRPLFLAHLKGMPHSKLSLKLQSMKQGYSQPYSHIQLCGDRLSFSTSAKSIRLINLKTRAVQDCIVDGYITQAILTDKVLGVLTYRTLCIFGEDKHTIDLPPVLAGSGEGEKLVFLSSTNQDEDLIVIVEQDRVTSFISHGTYCPSEHYAAVLQDGHFYIIRVWEDGDLHVQADHVNLANQESTTWTFSTQLEVLKLDCELRTRQQPVMIPGSSNVWFCSLPTYVGAFALRLLPGRVELVEEQKITYEAKSTAQWRGKMYMKALPACQTPYGPGSLISVLDLKDHCSIGCLLQKHRLADSKPNRDDWPTPRLFINDAYLVDRHADGSIEVYSFDAAVTGEEDEFLTEVHKKSAATAFMPTGASKHSVWTVASIQEVDRCLEEA